jgi:hypothetical protein
MDINRGPRWIDYKNKRVWFTDWSNLEGRELTEYILRSRTAVKKEIDAGERVMLSLIIGAYVVTNADSLKALTENAKIVAPYTRGSAVVGLDAMKKSLLRFVNVMSPLKTKAFDTQEEALEWLIGL